MNGRKRGGQPKPEGERRDQLLTIRLTRDEWAACERAAGFAKRGIRVWARFWLVYLATEEAKAQGEQSQP